MKKPDELVGRDSQIFDRQLARSKGAEVRVASGDLKRPQVF